MLPGLLVGKADSVVVIHVRDAGRGAGFSDMLQAFRRTSLWHIDNAFAAQLLRGPGNAPAVVSIGCSDKGERPGLFTDRR